MRSCREQLQRGFLVYLAQETLTYDPTENLHHRLRTDLRHRTTARAGWSSRPHVRPGNRGERSVCVAYRRAARWQDRHRWFIQ